MNKTKKLAFAAVSMAMAGTMVFSFAACNNGSGSGNDVYRPTNLEDTEYNAASSELTTVKVGNLNMSVLKSDNKKVAYPTGTKLIANIVDSGNADRSIAYDTTQISGKWIGLDGYTYYAGDLKPAWWQLGQNLGIDFVSNAKAKRSGSELKTIDDNKEWGDYNLVNSTVGAINTYATQLLDLSQFIDYMPNFAKFLGDYEIVDWSLQMGTNGEMYCIPYFDGNNDIEKYVMVQRDWVEVLLDGDLPAASTAISYLEQYKAKVDSKATTVKAAVESFMGTEGEWTVETVDPSKASDIDGDPVTLTVSYDDVIEALEDSDSELYKAVVAAGVTAPQTDSGNIVDIQNEIINTTNGAVTGEKLVKVLREYIKVAYNFDGKGYDEVGTKKLSAVFNGSYAGWDVDLMTAIYRCIVTNFKAFNGLKDAAAGEVYALAGREAKAQRQNDFVSLAGELYGIRGLESRLEYTYIDANGDLADARTSEETYDTVAKLNTFAKEGLLYTGTGETAAAVTKKYKSGSKITFMLHDYVQTQTTDGFTDNKFDFAPIVTPVSKWDDGTGEKAMRFTESWRSVKNSGVVVPLASVQNDPNKLAAVIAFVDYLFSNDGQIVASYGPMSTNGNGEDANGFWYGENGKEVLDADGKVLAAYKDIVDTADGVQYYVTEEYKSQYFTYNNVLYTGMPYNKRQIPIMTDNNTTFYLGGEVNGNKMDTNNSVGYIMSHVGNYTNYARGIVGAALPIGNKDQGFEYQCTAACGLDGAAVVNVAIQTGALKHVSQDINPDAWWYTIAPTNLPLTTSQSQNIGKQTQIDGASKTVGVFNPTSTAGYSNVFIDLAFYGYGTYGIGTCGDKEGDYPMTEDAAKLVKYITEELQGGKSTGLLWRIGIYETGWNKLKENNL